MASILDRKFKYVPAAATDIRKLFRRERKRIAWEKAKSTAHQEAAHNVLPMPITKGGAKK